jgi:hypothetical protein
MESVFKMKLSGIWLIQRESGTDEIRNYCTDEGTRHSTVTYRHHCAKHQLNGKCRQSIYQIYRWQIIRWQAKIGASLGTSQQGGCASVCNSPNIWGVKPIQPGQGNTLTNDQNHVSIVPTLLGHSTRPHRNQKQSPLSIRIFKIFPERVQSQQVIAL